MKVLALGALWVPYIRDTWFDAFRHVLGQDVVCVNAGPLLACKAMCTGQPEGYHSAYVYELLRREHFDYLFFYHDWIFGEYPDAFFEKVRRAGVKTLAFHPDDEPEHWYARNSAYDHHFDLVASHSSAGVQRRQATGWGERAMYLPWGYNPRSCYALPDSPKRYDVIFFGKHKISEKEGEGHVEDGKQREQVLLRLAEVCEQRGWSFRLFGFGWERHPHLKQYAGGVLSQAEMVRVLNESRVVFNPAWSSDGNPNAVQTKLRHFEVPGCGALQITNKNLELAALFSPEEEIVFYDSDDELLEKVERFVLDDCAREKISRAGHQRAIREHTLDHRVDSLFKQMRALYSPTQTVKPATARVFSLELKDSASVASWLAGDIDVSPDFYNADWVHVLGGNFKSAQIDYSSLQPFFRLLPGQMLTVGIFMDFEGLMTNPLQPKLIEGDGGILAGPVNLKDFDFSLLDSMGGPFVGVHGDGTARLLVNYVVPRERLNELLSAFASGSLNTVSQLETISTGRIVSELMLTVPTGYEQCRLGAWKFEYVRRLRVLFPRFITLGWRIVVYGVAAMGEVVLRMAQEEPKLGVIGVIDRSLKVDQYQGIPVMQPGDIRQVKPDILILTAGAAGPGIYASIQELEAVTCILPLYDLNHPAWRLLLP